jgi:hypothetical protein
LRASPEEKYRAVVEHRRDVLIPKDDTLDANKPQTEDLPLKEPAEMASSA